MQENKVTVVVKGVIIGATMIVPGVSGGTMAMILGIYDQLIGAISSFRKGIKDNCQFLLVFVLGAAVGAFLFSSHISWLLDQYYMPTMYFFVGAVIGGVPIIEKQVEIKKVSPDVVLYIFSGVGCVLMISAIPTDIMRSETITDGGRMVVLVLMGIVSAVALILPGISISHFFLIMGMYDELVMAIRELELGFIIPVGAGGLVGIVIFSKVLENMMKKYPKQTYMIILGFILGSVAEVLPGLPRRSEILFCAITGVLGYGVMNRGSKLQKY